MSERNYGTAECAECGRAFTKNRSDKRFCSHSCAEKFRYKHASFGFAKCEECGKMFTKSAPNQRFCSGSCASKFRNRLRNKHKSYGVAECAECGRTFTKSKPEQRYCSNSCKGTVVNELIGKVEVSEMKNQENKVENSKAEVVSNKNKMRGKFLTLDENIRYQKEYIEKIVEQHKKDLAKIKEQYRKDWMAARKTLAELQEQKKMQTKEQRSAEFLAVIADKYGVSVDDIDLDFIAKLPPLPSADNSTDEDSKLESSIVDTPEEDKELFEEVDSQSVSSTSAELQRIKEFLRLPEDASLAEVRQTFDANKNVFPPAVADHCEKVIGALERGEI